jgi:methylated-DNA-[protein]-cysteine S-methyltransferase
MQHPPLWNAYHETFMRFQTMIDLQIFLSNAQQYLKMDGSESSAIADDSRERDCLHTLSTHQKFLNDMFLSVDRKALKAIRLQPKLHDICRKFDAYFSGQKVDFTCPTHVCGTLFGWQVLHNTFAIPYGETRTYQQIARACGRSSAARAVGQILHRNPLPIIIPCHRVIGKSGALVGFASGLFRKQFLLQLEHYAIHQCS